MPSVPSTDTSHNRIPNVCKFPLVEPIEWKCEGCARKPKPRPRGHDSHSEIPGECRWATNADFKRHLGRRAAEQHPRNATVPTRVIPSHADVPGPHLNPDNEGAASSRDPAGSTHAGRAAKPPPAQPPDDDDDGRPLSELTRRKRRRRMTNPRDVQPRLVDKSMPSDYTDDWTGFDISKALRTLRHGTNAQQVREVRKLYIRW